MNIPVSKDENKRLRVLWQYDILDTVPEEVFDDLTDLAARICGAPIAMISLVDEDRQWFKSKQGITASETSRDISLCAHAILQRELFIIPDASKDARFARNPLVVSDPKIRFYAGAPLITPDGHALGTLCVIDQVPRELTEDQKQALRLLARHVMVQLELRRHAKELARVHEQREELEGHLRAARSKLASLKRELSRRGLRQTKSAKRSPKKSGRRH